MPGINPSENRSPSLPNIIRRFVDRALRSVYTMMPGRVIDYNPEKQTATVQPLFRFPAGAVIDPNAEVAEADLLEDLPALPDVPVMFPRSKHSTIYFRIDPGSSVMLVFSMFSLEKFLQGAAGENGTVDTQDTRHHNLSDAIALPGMFPTSSPIANLDDADIRIINDPPNGKRTEVYLGGDTGDVVVLPADGSFIRLGDKDASEHVPLGVTLNQELTNLVQSFVDNASTIVTTGTGPGVLSPAVVTAIETFKLNLENTIAEKARVK